MEMFYVMVAIWFIVYECMYFLKYIEWCNYDFLILFYGNCI